MGSKNLVDGSNAFHNVAKAYVNVVNDVATFLSPLHQTNTIKNEIILTQYSIKQGLKLFW